LLLANTFNSNLVDEYRKDALKEEAAKKNMMNKFNSKLGEAAKTTANTATATAKDAAGNAAAAAGDAAASATAVVSNVPGTTTANSGTADAAKAAVGDAAAAGKAVAGEAKDAAKGAVKGAGKAMKGKGKDALGSFVGLDLDEQTKALGRLIGQLGLCFGQNMAVCFLLASEMFYTMNASGDGFLMEEYPANVGIVFVRFACSIVLHLDLQQELAVGLDIMKLVMNHPYRFGIAPLAYVAGLLQVVSTIIIEIVAFIVLLTSTSYIEVILNFMTLQVIAGFDEAFWSAVGPNPSKEIVTTEGFKDLWKICRTSSPNAFKNEKNEIDDDTLPEENTEITHILYGFSDLSCFWKVCRLIYKFFKVIQITVWFYSIPFLFILGSYLIPFYY